MKDLDTLGVLGTQKTVFFQEPPIEYVQKIHTLEKKLEIALEVLGIIAMHSKDPVDAVQAACAISQIKEMEGVK